MGEAGSGLAEVAALAERLVAASSSGQFDEIRRAYAPDVVIWHNVTGREVTLEEALKAFGALAAKIRDLHYINVRVNPFEGGFLQRHTLVGMVGDQKLMLDACLVYTVQAGKVTRFEEYFDGEQLSKLGLSL
jgi:ketosteroid isomerase-like protein